MKKKEEENFQQQKKTQKNLTITNLVFINYYRHYIKNVRF